MNRKAQFLAGFVIMLMPPDAWSQTAPTSFLAVPGDGRATLRWDSVPNATGYNVKQARVSAGAPTVIATNVAESSFVTHQSGEWFDLLLRCVCSRRRLSKCRHTPSPDSAERPGS